MFASPVADPGGYGTLPRTPNGITIYALTLLNFAHNLCLYFTKYFLTLHGTYAGCNVGVR